MIIVAILAVISRKGQQMPMFRNSCFEMNNNTKSNAELSVRKQSFNFQISVVVYTGRFSKGGHVFDYSG